MPAKKPVRSPVNPPVTMPGTPAEPVVRYPSARSAMWLYCFVIIAEAAIIIPLSSNIEVDLLNFVVIMFTNAGFTLLAIALSHLRFSTLMGPNPRFVILLLSLLSGLMIWIPATWVYWVVFKTLIENVGPLTLNAPIASTVAPWSVLIQAGIILPICQGLLFWGYIQRALEGLGRQRGAVLTALLFAIYALLSGRDGFSGVSMMLLVGLLAAMVGYYTRSAWCSIAVLAGFGIADLLLENTLFTFLAAQFSDLLSVRWLLIVVVTAFISFVLIRVISVISTRPPEIVRPAPRGLWWVPLVLSLVLFMAGTYLEFGLRAANKARLSPPSRNSTVRPIVRPTAGPTGTAKK